MAPMTRWFTTTLVAGLLLVVGFVLPLLIVLHSVGYWDPDPSAERSEDTGSPTSSPPTSTTVATAGSAPGEGAWEALPDEHAVALAVATAIPRDDPAPPPPTTPATVPEPQPPVRTPVAPAPAPPPPVQAGGTIWDRLAQCESGGNWSINTGNGHYGGLQFTLQSWRGVGGSGYPHEHSREEQIARAERLLDLQGWGAWPGCARRLGLR